MNRFWKAVLLTTLVAGTLDIIAAHVHITIATGNFPNRTFHFIAGGAIGLENAMKAGPAIIPLGVFFHYLISFLFSLFFFLVYPAISRVSQNKYVNGIIITIVVWVTMSLIVLPLSAIPDQPIVFDLNRIIGMVVLYFVFGLPISIMAWNYYFKKPVTA